MSAPRIGQGTGSSARSAKAETYRRWYSTARWRRLRAEQLARQPLCERCRAQGRVTPATVCHHAVPHRGDEARFWAGPFASSCTPCHDIDAQREERGGRARQVLDDSGWPTDG